MSALATNNIELAVQRQLAIYLREALPGDVSVERSLIPTPPEAKRVTVLPSVGGAEQVALYIGNAARAHRQHDFTVRTWTEVIGDDQDAVEDAVQQLEAVIEDVVAEHPTLGDLDGLAMFGQQITVTPHPIFQPQPGLYFGWVEREISATGRYD